MSGIRAGLQIAVRLLKWAIRPTAFFVLSFSTAYAAGWVSTMPADSPDQDLCQALLDRLKHTDSRCLETAIDEYTSFTTPPWQMLDPSQHIELIAKLTGYIGGPDTMTDQQWSAKLQGAKEFAKGGGTLKVWRTRLLNFYADNGRLPVPPGNQSIVLMSRIYKSICPSHPSVTQNETFVVLPDLSGPDVNLDSGDGYGLAHSYPVLYKERTLFVHYSTASLGDNELEDGSGIMIYRLVKETNVHAPVCWFEYKANKRSREK